jgi:hypothetical protein
MAAGLGFKTFTTGEVLTSADVNGYLMQGVLVFASEAARDAAITSPQEGQFAFTKDNNSLWYYSGAAWVASGATGDIEGVTAGTGISGGGTSGTVTITNSMATEIDAKGDLVVGTGADTFARLAVGTNDYVLTADSVEATGLKWAAPAAGGALTLITTSTASAVATSVTLTSCFSATYRNYLVLMDGLQSTNTGEISIQMRAGATTQTTNYYAGRITYGTVGSVASTNQVNTSQIQVCPGSSNKFSLQAWIMNPQVGKVQFQSQFWSRNGDAGGSTLGFIDQTTSYDSMVISWGGNYTGTISVYGYGV